MSIDPSQITSFFNHPFFIIIGGLTVTLSLIGLLYAIICWFFGITPIIFRLGMALWDRKVAIFASLDNFENLKESLVDSSIFQENNIVHIKINNLDKAKNETIFLVDWETFGEKIIDVFATRKNHQTAIIIYAKPGSIPQEVMNDIANRTNTVVVNFKGRLLNDILTSLVTTTYERS